MSERIDVGVTIKGTEKVSSDLSKVDSKTKDLSGSVDMASASLDKMTGGAVSAFKGIAGGIKKAVLGMKTFKGALISTGIGALVGGRFFSCLLHTNTKGCGEVRSSNGRFKDWIR